MYGEKKEFTDAAETVAGSRTLRSSAIVAATDKSRWTHETFAKLAPIIPPKWD